MIEYDAMLLCIDPDPGISFPYCITLRSRLFIQIIKNKQSGTVQQIHYSQSSIYFAERGQGLHPFPKSYEQVSRSGFRPFFCFYYALNIHTRYCLIQRLFLFACFCFLSPVKVIKYAKTQY